MTGPRIYTSHDVGIGWSAHDDRMGADTSPIGRGDTEAEARADLLDQLADRGHYASGTLAALAAITAAQVTPADLCIHTNTSPAARCLTAAADKRAEKETK